MRSLLLAAGLAGCALPPHDPGPVDGVLPTVTAAGTWDPGDLPPHGSGVDTDPPRDTAAPVDTDPAPPPSLPPNILLVLADDAGLDKVGVYDVTRAAPATPTIDDLAARGVRFQNAWAAPTCSPSRATLLTGRHPFRHRIGRWIDTTNEATILEGTETTLPELLGRGPQPYASALVGKWHLAGFLSPSPALHPLRMGFDHHRGSLANPRQALGGQPQDPRGYQSWEKAVDGQLTVSTTYMTTDTVDEAVALAHTLPEPWLIVVAFNAPHVPAHVPPPPLPGSLLDPATASVPDMVDAAMEALDAELGRLLDEVGDDLLDRTLLVFASDNGTTEEATRPPLDPRRSKGTVYEGGVRVPLIVWGPGVALPGGTVVQTPVTLADLLPTLAVAAGVPELEWVDPFGDPLVLDGVSLWPLLQAAEDEAADRWIWTEAFYPAGPPPQDQFRWAIRGRHHKLAEEPPGFLRLFRLDGRPFDEGVDLLQGELDPADEAAMTALEVELDRLLREADRVVP